MDFDRLLAHCLAKPGAWKDGPWEGHTVARVDEKIFAFLGTDAVGLGRRLAGEPFAAKLSSSAPTNR